MQLSVAAVNTQMNEHIHACGGMHNVPEADNEFNNFNRSLIEAFKHEYGTCFLGKINNQDKSKAIKLTEYTGQMIFNFDYDFVIPSNDDGIVKLLDWHSKNNIIEMYSISKRIDLVFSRVETLGGKIFNWS